MRKSTSLTTTPFALVLLLLGLMLASCGTQTSEPVAITMVAGAVGKEFEVLEDQVAQFEAQHPDIQVQLIDLPESANDRHAAYIHHLEQHDPTIDIYMIDVTWTPEFGASGWTIPLDDYIASHDIDLDDFLNGSVQSNIWDGQMVSMPWFTDAGLLYYRQDLLDKYGFQPPQTWADLKEIAETIVAGEQTSTPEMAGFVFQGREYEGLVTNYLEYLWSHGAAVLAENGNQVILNSPQAVEALETFVNMNEIAPPGITSFQEADALNYFQSGHAVFMRNWPFAWAVLNDNHCVVKDKIALAPLPQAKPGYGSFSTLGGWQLGISAYSQHPDEAFELIAFLTSLEQQNYKAIHAGQAPTRRAAYQDPQVLAANPHFISLFNVLVSAKPRPIHPRYPEISEIIQQEVHRALTGQQDAATATETMAEAIQAVISPPPQETVP